MANRTHGMQRIKITKNINVVIVTNCDILLCIQDTKDI